MTIHQTRVSIPDSDGQASQGVMTNINWTAPIGIGKKSRKSRLIARITTSAVVTAASLGLLAGAASADQFSPFPGTGVHTFNNQFDDTCRLTVGPVYDQNGTSGSFAVIGGITVQNCSRRHSFEVYVYEAYRRSSNDPWQLVPNSMRKEWFGNVYGFGAGRILETPHICGGPLLYWYTGSIVDEYDANGNFIREVNQLSHMSQVPVQAEPAPC